MNITCPACETRYSVSVAFPASGRRVKCAKCGEAWNATPQDEPSAVLVEETPDEGPGAPETMESLPVSDPEDIDWESAAVPAMMLDPEWKRALEEEERLARGARIVDDADAASMQRLTVRRPARQSSARLLQAFTVGATLTVMSALLVNKEDVVAAFPSTARLFAAAGLDVNIRGLAFDGLVYEREQERGVPVLAVSGEVVNVAGVPVAVPSIRVALAGSGATEIYAWTVDPERTSLTPGERMPFRARLAAPPAEARAVSLRFIDQPETRIGSAQ